MRLTALAAAVLLTPAAMADVSLSIRAGDGTFWSDNLGTDGCQYPQIHIGVFAHFTNAAALAGATFNITATESRALFNGDRTLSITGPGLGRQAPFTLGNSSQAVFFNSSGWRIDEASDAANNPVIGISCAQGLASPTTANDVLLYQFTFNPSCSLTGVLVGLNISDATASVYTSLGAPPVPATVSSLSGAGMIFVPGPQPLVIGAAASLLAIRRRR